MTVFVVVPSLRLGGAEIQALHNCEALLDCGYRVTLVTLYRVDQDFFADRLAALKARGLTHHHLVDRQGAHRLQGPVRSASVFAQAVWRLRALYAEARPDYVYTRLWYASLVALAASTLGTQAPKLLFSEETNFANDPRTTALKRRIRLMLLTRAHRWFAPCRGLYDEAVAAGAPATSGEVFPNVVPLPAAPSPEPSAGPLRLGFLGRLVPEKGLERLAEMAAHLQAAGCDFELRVAGAGEEETRFRQAIAQAGLTPRVTMLGAVSDVPGFFADLDALVLTSHIEGFANVLVEANAHGVPVVAMNVPHGPPEIVRDGVNGFLVPNGDTEAMARVLATADRAGLAALRPGSRAIAAENYSLEAQRTRWQALVGAPA